jgi:hypothetical protein
MRIRFLGAADTVTRADTLRRRMQNELRWRVRVRVP